MDLSQTLEQIKRWTDDAFKLFGSQLSITSEDGKRANLSELYYDMQRTVEQASKQAATEFLAFSAIDAYLTRLPYLYPITLHDMMTRGSQLAAQAQDIEDMQREIRSAPPYQEWSRVTDTILAFANEYNLPIQRDDIDNLSEVTPILLDALQVPHTWKIMQWAKGADVGPGKAITYWNMPTFRSLYQFTESLKLSREERCIAFAMIEPLVEDAGDPMLAHFDITPELIRNVRSREGAEGLKKPWAGFAALGLKRGENIFVLKEPLSHDRNPYGHNSFNYYNKRASYMPYQVTFPNADKPGLVVRNAPAWNLRHILDKEQALWLPVMVSAVQKAFFDTAEAVQQSECHVSTESVQLLPEPKENSLVPKAYVHRPTGMDWETLPGDPASALLKHLGVDADTVADIPLELPVRDYMPLSEYQREVTKRAREAVARVAEQRFWELFDKTEIKVLNMDSHVRYRFFGSHGTKTIGTMFTEAAHANEAFLLKELNNPDSRIHTMVDVKIDGSRCLEHVVGGKERIRPVKTGIDDGRQQPGDFSSLWLFYPDSAKGKRPPVSIKVIPKTPADLSYLMGRPLEELDWRLRTWNVEYESNDPVLQIKNPYSRLHFHVHFVMSKKEYKRLLPRFIADFEAKQKQLEKEMEGNL